MHPSGERVTSTESTRRMIQVEIKGRYQQWLEMEPRYEAVALRAVAVRRSRVLLDEEVLIRNPIDSVSRSVVVSVGCYLRLTALRRSPYFSFRWERSPLKIISLGMN